MGPPLLQIFVAERSRVIALVRRIVGCAATAEDVAQDTLIRLWARPVKTGDRSLLFRTAQNLALDHLRRRRVRREYVRGYPRAADSVEINCVQPESASIAAQECRLLINALSAIPERAQRVFLLHRVDNL